MKSWTLLLSEVGVELKCKFKEGVECGNGCPPSGTILSNNFSFDVLSAQKTLNFEFFSNFVPF